MKRLDLSNNELTGPIPPGLGNLANLAQLSLHQNELTGPVPSEFERLTNLIQLSLNGNGGAWGYDFRKRALVHPSFSDIMGYCPPREWISGFHFSNALRFRLSDYDHPALPDRAGQTTATLLVWGGVDGNGAPFLEPAFVVDAPARLPDATGDHRVVGRTADGADLFSMSFAMPGVPDGDGSSAFAFTVPVQSSWAGALASITLSGPGGSVVLDGNSDRAVAILRNPDSGQVRGFLRGVAAEDADQVAAMADSGAAGALEVLFSRGLPDALASGH